MKKELYTAYMMEKFFFRGSAAVTGLKVIPKASVYEQLSYLTEY
jgi:hypothetical protein